MTKRKHEDPSQQGCAQAADGSASVALMLTMQLTRAGLPWMPCLASLVVCTRDLEGPKQNTIVMAVFGAN
jgi:hypothetical protein